MPLHFYRGSTESAGHLRARNVLEVQGGYTFAVNKDVSTVVQADIDAASGFVIARDSGATAVASIKGALLASGKPIIVLDRAYADDILISSTGGLAAGVSTLYLQTAGVTPLAGGSAGTKTVASASSTLGYLSGTIAAGAVIYSTRTVSVVDQIHHVIVPAGGALVGGTTRAGAVGYATWLSEAEIANTNALMEQFMWRTALQVLGDPASHNVAGATITISLGTGPRAVLAGGTVELAGSAVASDASTVTLAWSAPAGTFGTPTAGATTYTPATTPGPTTVTLTATSATAATATAALPVTVVAAGQAAALTDSALTGAMNVGGATAHGSLGDALDATYVAATAVGHVELVKLSTLVDPATGAGHTFIVDQTRAAGATGATKTLEVVQSTAPAADVLAGVGTVITSRTLTVPAVATSEVVTLTTAEADLVTSYAALWVRLTTATLA